MMNVERLIEIVQQYPYLYDMNDKRYGDFTLKEHTWKDISKQLNQPGLMCKKQWNNLRDAFRRSLKKRKLATNAQYACKKWKYEDEMLFLIPHLKERERVLVYSSDDETNETNETNETTKDVTNDGNEEEPLEVNHWLDQEQTQIEDDKKFKMNSFPQKTDGLKMFDRDTLSSILMNCLVNEKNNAHSEGLTPQLDEIDAFFISIAATVKRLTPYNRAVAKAKVFSVVSELELQELSVDQHIKGHSSPM